jgi:hypothetical protein
VGDASAVPKLAKDAAPYVVDGVCHLPPTHDLGILPEAWTVDDALALLGNSGAFGHDQARRGALGVILAHDRRRDAIWGRARPRHRRHPDAVGKRKAVKVHRREQVGHDRLIRFAIAFEAARLLTPRDISKTNPSHGSRFRGSGAFNGRPLHPPRYFRVFLAPGEPKRPRPVQTRSLISTNPGISMFDDPSGAGTTIMPTPFSGLISPALPGFVIAIPVRDEEERLPACLRALARQSDRSGRSISPTQVRVVLFANDCTDRSASLARQLGAGLSLDLRVVEARLPPAIAHAGSARRAAMDLAEAWLVEAGESDGVILVTDADSQVAPNWIAENLAAFAAGAEAVLGRIDLDEEGAYLPEALHRRGQLEDTYERLLTELSWLLDPLEHDPWPHHATTSGASLGVTRAAYTTTMREFAIARLPT